MKKILSIVLCMILMASAMFVLPVSAEKVVGTEKIDDSSFKVRMVDEDEYYYEYFKVLDGVLYQYFESHATVEAIIPEEKDAKINIPSEIICEGKPMTVSYIVINSEKIPANDITTEKLKIVNENVAEINIPDSVVWIKGIANAPNLKKVTISKNVKEIENCFYGCENLELVIDEENKRYSVSDDELYYLRGKNKRLISVFTSPKIYEIPSDVSHFVMPFGENNKTVKTIVVKNDIKLINAQGLNALATIKTEDHVIERLKLIGNNKITKLDLSKAKINRITVNFLKNLVSLKVPEGVKRVNAFGCVKLNKINLPKSVKRIKMDDFAKTGFEKFTVPNSVISIAPHAFSGSKKLKKIIIPESVRKIRVNAFQNCKRLSKIVLKHKKAPRIYDGAFNDTKPGIKFYVRNRKVARRLKNRLKGKIKNAKIYVKGKLVFKNVK